LSARAQTFKLSDRIMTRITDRIRDSSRSNLHLSALQAVES
jgi:hypothetical protein